MEPITAGAIATLAFTKIFEKSIETFTEAALAKMDELRKKIWDKLRGNPKAETALLATEQGSKEDLNRVAAYLQIALHEEPQFAEEIEKLAREIEAGRKAEKGMTQNNYDSSTGYQIGTATGTNYFGGTHHNHPGENKI
ncbi:hypothetical protein VB620_14715 [Nodularia harveyana UHCC-0300]|uniref:NACHT-NTPase and P-loop NTPases N-terminal domain-containing protein n=1 Tax=Nodularia harveyana UHCC-0300 TaxID=2974287 RepID=A0ABU5UGG9_9CYAN|nr:hypothetical protein [Nodularia harveyana]MEA5582589.1 hypothetical protein [Nodularia harveyana UHCC-0300]